MKRKLIFSFISLTYFVTLQKLFTYFGSFMTRLSLTLLYLAVSLLPTKGQTVVRDAVDGQPVVQASVFDEHGRIIGVTDADGRLPNLAQATAIRLTHIAYQPADVATDTIGQDILMQPALHFTKEVVVQYVEPYCLKLTCYHRRYVVNGKGTNDDVPPMVSFTDGLCDVYLFRNSLNETRAVALVTRNVISDGMVASDGQESVPELEFRPMTEQYKKNRRFSTSASGQTVHAVCQVIGPGESQEVKLSVRPDGRTAFQKVGTLLLTEDVRNGVYRRSDYQKVSQGDLMAYSETKRIQGELVRGTRTYTADLWCFDDYFVVSGAYLSKQQYKEERAAAKHRQQQALSAADIDCAVAELQVPELTKEVQQKLELTRMMQEGEAADYDLALGEVVATGRKKYQFRNNVGLAAPRFIREGDPRIAHAVSMAQLLAPLGLKVVGHPGEQDIQPVSNTAKLKIFVDNFEEEDHDHVVHLSPADVESIEYFTPNNPQNSVFGVRPESSSLGHVPGVLFIFLK